MQDIRTYPGQDGSGTTHVRPDGYTSKNPLPIAPDFPGIPAFLRDNGVMKQSIRNLGTIVPGEKINIDYQLSCQHHEQIVKYAPRTDLLFIGDNTDNVYARTAGRNWASTFIILPNGMVVLMAEYVHGSDIILVSPPAGVLEEGETAEQCALREGQEESGVVLERVVPLSGPDGLVLSARRSPERTFPFLGVPKLDKNGFPLFQAPKPDSGEHIFIFQMKLASFIEWMHHPSFMGGAPVRDIAYAAFYKLKLLSLVKGPNGVTHVSYPKN